MLVPDVGFAAVKNNFDRDIGSDSEIVEDAGVQQWMGRVCCLPLRFLPWIETIEEPPQSLAEEERKMVTELSFGGLSSGWHWQTYNAQEGEE